MSEIRFTDGASYDKYMGVWSRLAGEEFLTWLAPPPRQRWLDVGCGNGAFTQRIAGRCDPISLHGVDPSEAQLAYARAHPLLRRATFQVGDAMALPCRDASFDMAVMALAIFFVPDPAKGVAELRRVLAPDGVASAYAWDLPGGGFPYQALMDEMNAMGATVPQAPSPNASSLETLRALWEGAGFTDVATRVIEVQRTFANFDEWWAVAQGAASMGPQLRAMAPAQHAALAARLKARLPADTEGRITYRAWANAVKGRAPGKVKGPR